MAELSGPDLGRLLNELKETDKKLANALRKNLRTAAKPAVEDVKRKVRQPTPDQGNAARTGADAKDASGKTRGVRNRIADGLAVRITSGKRGARVAITSSGKGMAPWQRVMVRLYNKSSWRHPVFATDEWVTQSGNPYFEDVLKTHTDDVQRAIQAAVDEANAALLRAK